MPHVTWGHVTRIDVWWVEPMEGRVHRFVDKWLDALFPVDRMSAGARPRSRSPGVRRIAGHLLKLSLGDRTTVYMHDEHDKDVWDAMVNMGWPGELLPRYLYV